MDPCYPFLPSGLMILPPSLFMSLWLWPCCYLAWKTTHPSRHSLHISFSVKPFLIPLAEWGNPFLYWDSTFFVFLSLYCHFSHCRVVWLHIPFNYIVYTLTGPHSPLSPSPGAWVGWVSRMAADGFKDGFQEWQSRWVSRMAAVFVDFPSRGEAYFSTPWIWADLVTCFKE